MFPPRRNFLPVLAVVVGLLGFLVGPPTRAEEKAPPPALPRLVDLGAGKCIPCKKMAPIIEALKKDYAGIVDVIFIDVWKDPKAGTPYRIRLIPTQVFFDRTGKEVFRHEGFFSREDIEKVFKEKFGVTPVARDDEEKKDTSEQEKGNEKGKTSTGARL